MIFSSIMMKDKLYEVLYDKRWKARDEVFSQRLFYAIADAYCSANNVDLNREPNAGNGPVDFKISSGYTGRVLIEIKKSNNGKLVQGYETQLKAYGKAEATRHLIYLIVCISVNETQIKKIVGMRDSALARGDRAPEVFVVDARRRLSASKRRR
jgi:hypothetical protein